MAQRILRGALGAALCLMIGGCSEQVTTSLACDELCVGQSLQLRDTVLTAAVVLDTTFVGFPRLGTTSTVTLVARGDTADVRAVARFDTLPSTYHLPNDTTTLPITRVDSATLRVMIDTTLGRPTEPIRIEAFDVDTTANDTLPATLLPLFRADRSLGSTTFAAADVKDTLRLVLKDSAVLAKITGKKRLRVGLRLFNAGTSGAGVQLQLIPALNPVLRYRASPDTLVPALATLLNSSTPADVPTIAGNLVMYPVIAAGALPPPDTTLVAVGGLAGARGLFQFDFPAILLDSVQVVRATLQLTQRPSRARSAATDTVRLVTHPVTASLQVGDLYTAAQFLAPPGTLDTLRIAPRGDGRRDVELVTLVRAWRAVGTKTTTRSIVLRVLEEGFAPGEIVFYSMQAAPALRPRLRLTYVPRRGFGLP